MRFRLTAVIGTNGLPAALRRNTGSSMQFATNSKAPGLIEFRRARRAMFYNRVTIVHIL